MSAFRGLLAALLMLAVPLGAQAQKQGGTLRVIHRDSPGSLSIHEEGTNSAILPMMGVFNNLVLYDQHKVQSTMDTIVPELATGWTWSQDGKDLTFTLRQGVKWHDGKPFTAADVKCTFDWLTDKGKEKFKINRRAGWYFNIEDVTTNGDYEATIHMKRPQPAMMALLASGDVPMYPCHISLRQQRTSPVGTGPFKFTEFKANESIKVVRNPDYWKPGRPYLDAIEYIIISSRSTAMLGFVSGKFDLTFPYEMTVPLMKELKAQMPSAICDVSPTNMATNILMNPVPPFDDLDMRRAVTMALDRKAFIEILTDGAGDIGATMMPSPEGQWGMPEEVRRTLPGLDPDVDRSREAARAIMRAHGYGPDKHLKVKISTRNVPSYRDATVLMISHLKEIWIDAEMELVETSMWVPKLSRRDYQIGVSVVLNAIDDPDQNLFEYYVCGSRTYMDYCDKEIDRLVVEQSSERDQEKRKRLVWEIDRRVTQDAVRPMINFYRGVTCMRPELKNLTIMSNGSSNGWRMEDVWLDR